MSGKEPIQTMREMYRENPQPYTAAQIMQRMNRTAVDTIIQKFGVTQRRAAWAIGMEIAQSEEAIKHVIRASSGYAHGSGWVPVENIEEMVGIQFRREPEGSACYDPKRCGNASNPNYDGSHCFGCDVRERTSEPKETANQFSPRGID